MTAGRARLFVALELPAAARTARGGLQDAALSAIAGLRLIEADALHLTLCFLGSRALEEVAPIARACASVAQTGPPGLALAEAIWLPVRRPSVVAVRIADPQGRLEALQAALARALTAGGWYEAEERASAPRDRRPGTPRTSCPPDRAAGTRARGSGRRSRDAVPLAPGGDGVALRGVGSSPAPSASGALA